jgi:hypothetical protein
MDAHLITKIIHMSAVSLLILVFVARAATLFIDCEIINSQIQVQVKRS